MMITIKVKDNTKEVYERIVKYTPELNDLVNDLSYMKGLNKYLYNPMDEVVKSMIKHFPDYNKIYETVNCELEQKVNNK